MSVANRVTPSHERLGFGLSTGGAGLFYWFLKWIALGPVLRVVFRPRVSGSENVPDHGPAILASSP